MFLSESPERHPKDHCLPVLESQNAMPGLIHQNKNLFRDEDKICSADVMKDIDEACAHLFSQHVDSTAVFSVAQRDEPLALETAAARQTEAVFDAYVHSFRKRLPLQKNAEQNEPPFYHEDAIQLLSNLCQIKEHVLASEIKETMLTAEISHLMFLLDIWRLDAAAQISFCSTRSTKSLKRAALKNSEPSIPNATFNPLECSTTSIVLQDDQFENFFFPKFVDVTPHFILSDENKVPQSAIDNLFSAYPESTYPSRALTMKDYKQKLCKLPTLCFRKTVEVSNVLIVPDFKQDSKDLSRDIIRLNGKELPGTIGYRTLYETVAKHLLPDDLQESYVNYVFLEKKTLINHSDSGISPQCYPEALTDAFCVAELRALILLHIVNRTLAGGQCFDQVMSVFSNEKCAFIVPNSRGARPLEMLIGHKNVDAVTATVLESHTTFKLHPVPCKTDAQDVQQSHIANVHALFVADLNVSETLSFDNLREISVTLYSAFQNVWETHSSELDTHVSQLVSSRLLRWIAHLAQKEHTGSPLAAAAKISTTPPTPTSTQPLSTFAYRIYLTQRFPESEV